MYSLTAHQLTSIGLAHACLTLEMCHELFKHYIIATRVDIQFLVAVVT